MVLWYSVAIYQRPLFTCLDLIVKIFGYIYDASFSSFVTYYQIIRLSLLSVCYLSAIFNSFHLLDCLLYCHSSLWSSTDSLNPWPHFAGSSEGHNVLCHARLVETFGWTGYILENSPNLLD